MAYNTPKTNWNASDIPNPDDFNRIEGNAEDNHERLNGIEDGTTKVPSAENADNAEHADNADNAMAIDGVSFKKIKEGTHTIDTSATSAPDIYLGTVSELGDNRPFSVAFSTDGTTVIHSVVKVLVSGSWRYYLKFDGEDIDGTVVNYVVFGLN